MKLVIVESPSKINKIKKYLGSGYQVKASLGHIRQLADTGADNLGITLSEQSTTVECDYTPSPSSAKLIKSLRTQAKKAERVILATDPDREGEAIAWHLAQVLGLQNPQRARFDSITQPVVVEAVQHPQALDTHLAEAARTRDALDKIVGYKLSPLLWELNNGAKSAGRCQSAALHLLCEREREIKRFVPQPYWRIEADFGSFGAVYTDETGKTRIFDRDRAEQITESLRQSSSSVEAIQQTEQHKSPPPPLTTSTLQQEASKQYGFSAKKTMKLAQRLYEEGVITYHRTDSVRLAPEFQGSVNRWLQENHPDCATTQTTQHYSQTRSQEAHEAIRPVKVAGTAVNLSSEAQRVYKLIWQRAIASQCAQAVVKATTVKIKAGEHHLKAQGKQLLQAGYTKFWQNLDHDSLLPKLSQGQTLTLQGVEKLKQQTSPPSQISESALVQQLEREGIGRPSTYSAIIETLECRRYVERQGNHLVPAELGLQVDRFLTRIVPDLISADFTAQMEHSLDLIAQGQKDWQVYLVKWYHDEFLPALSKGHQLVEEEFGTPQDQPTNYVCQFCDQPGLKKRFSNSPNLAVDHFLFCPACESPHFWSDGSYQLPYRLRRRAQVDPANLSDYDCPVCGEKLEYHQYERSGRTEEMLRCCALKQDDCEQVAYFPSEAGWKSKQYGVITKGKDINFANLI